MWGIGAAMLVNQRMQRQMVRVMEQARFNHMAQQYSARGWQLIEVYEPRRGEFLVRVQRPTTIPRVKRTTA